MYFFHTLYQVHNGSCYLIVQAPACLSCSGGQGRGCLSVMVGVVGGILLSSCPLASLSCPPPVLSLSLVWISCLVRSRNSPAKVATHQGRCHNSKVFVNICEWGHIDTAFVGIPLLCIVKIIT